MTDERIVELISVTKRFGATVAVDSVSLKIPGGAYCCLLGPSGCGKTTTLRMIAGHETVSSGDIRIGREVVTDLPPLSRRTAMMFQNYALFPHLTALDNVAFSLKMRGLAKTARHARARELLTLVHMEAYADRLPAQLSGGQQQRVALARALVTEPSVLLLDEPLSALDPFLRVRMREELKRLQAELGVTFVHVTHSQEEALALADVIVVMDDGKVQQAGPAREIFETPRSAFVARFIGGHNVVAGEVVALTDGHAVLRSAAGEFRVAGAMPIGTAAAVAVRSDKVRLAGTGDAGEGALRGHVANIEYHGPWLRVRLEGEALDDFVVTVADQQFDRNPVRIGDAVAAVWAAGDARLLQAA
jgi:putative spermidine/putrescine transport system ATP-binding protein